LLQVIAVDVADCSVTLNVPKNVTPYRPASDSHKHPLLRRWDQSATVSVQGDLSVTEGTPITLEDGIQINFQPGGLYATGDYWLIPARVAGNGMLDWPSSTAADGSTTHPAALPPRELHHHAVLGITGDNGSYQECCCRFGTLCDLIQASRTQQPGAASKGAVLARPATVAPVAATKVTPAKARSRKAGTKKATVAHKPA
jgi:hypothetical protein